MPSVGYPLLTAAAAGMIWFAASRSERVHVDQLRSDDYPGATEPRGGHRRRGTGVVDVGVGAAAREPAGVIGGPATGPLVALGTDGIRSGGQPTPPSVERTGPDASVAPLKPARSPAAAPPPPPSAVARAQFGQPATAVASPHFGLIAIYTLLDGRGEEFDRLAERTVEAVRAQEPDTLLFVVHTVPKAPMQRIFYEVYRDRMAYREHQRKPYVEDFFAGHRQHVLATNVIELDLRYAKVSALPLLGAMSGRDGGG